MKDIKKKVDEAMPTIEPSVETKEISQELQEVKPEDKKVGLIYEKIAKVMADCPEIGKDMTNTSQNFKFRGIDQFYDALHKIMAKHQVFSTSKIVQMNEKEYETKKFDYKTKKEVTQRMYSVSGVVGYTFWTVDGSSIYTEVMTKGMDYGDKETNKAMSIAHKYALIQIFAIATNEPDPDGESPEVITDEKMLDKKPTYPNKPAGKPVAPKTPPAKKPEEPTYASERDIKTIQSMLDGKIDKDKQAKWLEDFNIKSLQTLPSVRAKKMIEFLINMPSQKGEAPKEEAPVEDAPAEDKPKKAQTREEAIKELEDMGEEVPALGTPERAEYDKAHEKVEE